jgi:outer membrane protein TolC
MSTVCWGLVVGSVVAGMLGIVRLGHALPMEEAAAPASVPSLPPLVLTLRGALDAAIDQNPTVQLYKERIEAARAQVLTQFGALLPNLSSTVEQSRHVNFLGTFGLSPIRTNPFSIFDARVNASQNLLSLSLIQKWRASRESLKGAEFDADVSTFDTMASAALSYMDALKAEATVRAHDANRQVMNELLAVLKQRQRSGVATGLDTVRLESQLANEGQLLSVAQYDRTHALLNLVTQLGLPIETPVSLSDALQSVVRDTRTPDLAVEEAIGKRPEVQAQAKRVRAAELTYSSITGERIPSLVARGDYGLIGNRYNNALDTYNMALLLQVPIFDGAQREGRISEARSQWRQEAWRMRAVANQVKFEVHDALAALPAAQEQVTIAHDGLQAALRELSLARERFAVVSGNNQFEVTNALNNVARARVNWVTALYQLNTARVNFARATGNLNTMH